MDTFFINKLSNQLPPVPPGNHKEYFTDQMTIIQTKHVFWDVRCFDCYQFVISHASFPPAQHEKYKIFPINPGQYHQVLIPRNNKLYISIFVDSKYLQEVSRAIFGQTEVIFKNESCLPSQKLLNLIDLFMQELENKQAGYQFILNTIQNQIIVILLRELKSNLSVNTNSRQYSSGKGIHKVIEFMNEHCTENFSIQDLAQLINYSPFHFIKIFKSETGQTPLQYLLELKLGRAKDMLKHRRDLTITEICYLCGFNSLSHFTAVFKKKIGIPPSRYRELVRQD